MLHTMLCGSYPHAMAAKPAFSKNRSATTKTTVTTALCGLEDCNNSPSIPCAKKTPLQSFRPTTKERGPRAPLFSCPRRAFTESIDADDSSPRISFISIVKERGIESLVGAAFPASRRFDSALRGLFVESAHAGIAICTFVVTPELQNSYGTLHGGAISTVVDVLGTLALLSMDQTRAGVSVDLNVSFMSAAEAGDKLVATGSVLKTGRTLGYTQVEIRRAKDNKLIVRIGMRIDV